jgi:hypothetical protein
MVIIWGKKFGKLNEEILTTKFSLPNLLQLDARATTKIISTR